MSSCRVCLTNHLPSRWARPLFGGELFEIVATRCGSCSVCVHMTLPALICIMSSSPNSPPLSAVQLSSESCCRLATAPNEDIVLSEAVMGLFAGKSFFVRLSNSQLPLVSWSWHAMVQRRNNRGYTAV